MDYLNNFNNLKEYPKISIVTPSYNQAEFLEATINSVLSQNYPNLEYIIIDGGSTDGSLDIIKKYDNYLHFWCSEPDAGQYNAINKGFSHSTGEIMAWLNSDDMYLPWTFKTVADIMSTFPTVEWLTTLNPGFWDYHGFCSGFTSAPGYSMETFLDSCYLPWNNSKGLTLNNIKGLTWIQQESTFWRRELWNSIGGCLRTDIKLASDFDLWCRFYTKTELYGTTSPLGGFRIQYKQRSRNIEEYLKECNISLSSIQKSLNWKPNILRNILFMNLRKIPRIRKFVLSKWGYKAKKIFRAERDQPDSYWEIENYRF
ncbi:glycosyltransferase [Dolichospermum planctonicum UHCC 0167]|uniref:glycosyltransferase family 2 protein n=1 Tax=Dolichospermum planctonicum TaxID=136072 RepID=UPI00144301D7|nr:glycosyltransferase family 2 protein [Dolichospermum planctonicum]MCW9680034.1 glycosyltransferase [Dolichospermum planctonicum UHCC 0167]